MKKIFILCYLVYLTLMALMFVSVAKADVITSDGVEAQETQDVVETIGDSVINELTELKTEYQEFKKTETYAIIVGLLFIVGTIIYGARTIKKNITKVSNTSDSVSKLTSIINDRTNDIEKLKKENTELYELVKNYQSKLDQSVKSITNLEQVVRIGLAKLPININTGASKDILEVGNENKN